MEIMNSVTTNLRRDAQTAVGLIFVGSLYTEEYIAERFCNVSASSAILLFFYIVVRDKNQTSPQPGLTEMSENNLYGATRRTPSRCRPSQNR